MYCPLDGKKLTFSPGCRPVARNAPSRSPITQEISSEEAFTRVRIWLKSGWSCRSSGELLKTLCRHVDSGSVVWPCFNRIRTTCLRALREVVTHPDTPLNSAGSSPSCSFSTSTSSSSQDAVAASVPAVVASSTVDSVDLTTGPVATAAAYRSHTPASSVVPSANGSPSSSSASLLALGRPSDEDSEYWQDSEDESVGVCPIEFSEIWVGIAGCDSDRDAMMMSEPLSRFL